MAEVDEDYRIHYPEYNPDYILTLNANRNHIDSITFKIVNTRLLISYVSDDIDDDDVDDDVDTTIRFQMPVEQFLEIYGDGGFDVNGFTVFDEFIIERDDNVELELYCDFIKLFHNSTPVRYRGVDILHKLFINDLQFVNPSFLTMFTHINIKKKCYVPMFNYLYEHNAFINLQSLIVKTLLGNPCDDAREKKIKLGRFGMTIKKRNLNSFKDTKMGNSSRCHDIIIFLNNYEALRVWKELSIRTIKISDIDLFDTYLNCNRQMTKYAVKF